MSSDAINETQFVVVEFKSSQEYDFVPYNWIYNFQLNKVVRNKSYKTWWNSDKRKSAPEECGETSLSKDRENNKFFRIYFKKFCGKYYTVRKNM